MDVSSHLSNIAFITVLLYLKRQLVTYEHSVVLPHWCRAGAGYPASEILTQIKNNNNYTAKKNNPTNHTPFQGSFSTNICDEQF